VAARNSAAHITITKNVRPVIRIGCLPQLANVFMFLLLTFYELV
jgi:hypothetical protein